MLLTRMLTAIIGMPLILMCVYCGNVPFYIMMLIISFLCVHEYLIISKKYNPHNVVSLVMAAAFFVFLYFFKDIPVNKVAVAAVTIMLVLFGIEVFGKNPVLCIGRIASSFLGAFFIPLTLMHIVYIRNLTNGMKLTFFIFIVVWTLDTMAYAFGKVFGKHKLAKNVSPKKTLEGTAAGIVFGILAAVACRYIFMCDILTLQNAAILGLVVAVVGQFSDLAESLIKRDGSVKDSGKIIPGHGGVFDRFDSYMFAAPAMYYALQLLK
ncbi:phosphatidate cytidylyltransferase [Candidatus Endomicrobiellum agilis]|uniref:phosphatidate cytidylyltransferase n=1 Tax=Candidatus Endomicrobiellum agilis TaxID=3238957 RepID=UPI00357D1A0F|nr:phosphatidate cytidylyltransferase [Endomicrobium sp.]